MLLHRQLPAAFNHLAENKSAGCGLLLPLPLACPEDGGMTEGRHVSRETALQAHGCRPCCVAGGNLNADSNK